MITDARIAQRQNASSNALTAAEAQQYATFIGGSFSSIGIQNPQLSGSCD